jgi:hypothetical protein
MFVGIVSILVDPCSCTNMGAGGGDEGEGGGGGSRSSSLWEKKMDFSEPDLNESIAATAASSSGTNCSPVFSSDTTRTMLTLEFRGGEELGDTIATVPVTVTSGVVCTLNDFWASSKDR